MSDKQFKRMRRSVKEVVAEGGSREQAEDIYKELKAYYRKGHKLLLVDLKKRRGDVYWS